MTFDMLMEKFGNHVAFSRSDLSLMFNESDASIGTAMHRLKKSGKILELKRGLYAFANPWRKAVLHPPLVANLIYSPSYLSGLWALSWYGIIPEKVELNTSVTLRPTRNFENSFGRFSYQSVKADLFNGWERTEISGAEVLIATPEKAITDYLYLESGEWDSGRMESMRFDPYEIDGTKLEAFLRATGEARLARAFNAWKSYAADQAEGTVVL
jgi:predicted transcriptional regulator of viral defense system